MALTLWMMTFSSKVSTAAVTGNGKFPWEITSNTVSVGLDNRLVFTVTYILI